MKSFKNFNNEFEEFLRIHEHTELTEIFKTKHSFMLWRNDYRKKLKYERMYNKEVFKANDTRTMLQKFIQVFTGYKPPTVEKSDGELSGERIIVQLEKRQAEILSTLKILNAENGILVKHNAKLEKMVIAATKPARNRPPSATQKLAATAAEFEKILGSMDGILSKAEQRKPKRKPVARKRKA